MFEAIKIYLYSLPIFLEVQAKALFLRRNLWSSLSQVSFGLKDNVY